MVAVRGSSDPRRSGLRGRDVLPGRGIQGCSPREERITVTETASSGKSVSSHGRVCGLEYSTNQRPGFSEKRWWIARSHPVKLSSLCFLMSRS